MKLMRRGTIRRLTMKLMRRGTRRRLTMKLMRRGTRRRLTMKLIRRGTRRRLTMKLIRRETRRCLTMTFRYAASAYTVESRIQTRRAHAALVAQATVVVVKNRRVSQSVHHRLVQEDVVALPGGIGYSSALLVHIGHPKAAGPVMRHAPLWAPGVQADSTLPIT